MADPKTRFAREQHEDDATIFVTNAVETSLKDDLASMEHPVFSLSKSPDKERRIYKRNGHTLEVIPSDQGIANIWDKDLLIYLASQVTDALNHGLTVSRRIQFTARDYLRKTKRGVSGRAYLNMQASLDRLMGTHLKTNIKTGDQEITERFALIDRYKIHRVGGTSEGRMEKVEVVLSEWYWNAITAREVLTLDPDYFDLTSAFQRRLYELVRKHCGDQLKCHLSLTTIYEKIGSTGAVRRLRHELRQLAGGEAPIKLLRYLIWFNDETDQLIAARDTDSGRQYLATLMAEYSGVPQQELFSKPAAA